MEITKELWGKSACGKEIFLYTLKNETGAYVQLSSVGAGIVSAVVPDKEGNLLMSFSDIRYRKAISVMVLVLERFPADMQTALLSESFLLTESNILFL